MRSVLVVVVPPFFDARPGVAHGQEPGSVEALLAKPAIERLDVGVVGRFAGAGEVELDLVEIGSLVEQPAGEFRAIVDPDASRLAVEPRQAIELIDDLIGAEVRSRHC